MNRKKILKVVLVLVLGCILSSAGNLWAKSIRKGTATITADAISGTLENPEVTIAWEMWQRTETDFVPADFNAPTGTGELLEAAQYITTFMVKNNGQTAQAGSLVNIQFSDVALYPMPEPGKFQTIGTGGIGIVSSDPGTPLTPLAHLEFEPPFGTGSGGGHVTFNFISPLVPNDLVDELNGQFKKSQRGWIASLLGLEAINVTSKFVYELAEQGETQEVEIPSILGFEEDPLSNGVPEPATLLLLGSGLLLAGIFRRKITNKI